MSTSIEKRQQKEKRLLIEQFSKTPIVQFSCEKVGVGRATYYRWRKEDAEFVKDADEALQESVSLMNDLAESQLLSAIREKNMTAIIFWLKNRHKAYSTKVELTGKISTELGHLTEEQETLIDKAIDLVMKKGKHTDDATKS